MARRSIPDEFQKPTPHAAPAKSVVEKVLGGVLTAGNSVATLVAGLLAGVLVIYSGYVIYDSFSTQYNAYSSAWDLLQYKPEFIDDYDTPLGPSALKEITDDYRAWLTVYDTSIDYPVLQSEDDLYYAWHNIYGESSLTGMIYMAAQNSPDFSDSYNLIYGHHMDNGAMFGRLDSFREESYYNSHKEGILVSESGVYDVEFFAVVSTDAYESRIYTVGDRAQEVLEFLAAGGEDGVGVGTEVLHYDANVARTATQVLALSTCASAETNGRLAIFGKMTKRNIIMLDAIGYEGIYDGQEHTLTASASVKDAVLEYSLDDGKTWSTQMPTIRDVGTYNVLVRATSEANGSAITEVILRVDPRPVTVRVDSVTKYYGDPDPEFTVTIEGLLDGDSISYTIRRADGEDIGVYQLLIDGEALQGNYAVTFENGVLNIVSQGTVIPVPQETISIAVQKVWVDEDPSTRPASIGMMLLGGDEPQLVTLSAANGWSATVDNLPAGRQYSWSEPDVAGYTQTSSMASEGFITITNTKVEAPPVPAQDYTLTIRYHYPDGTVAAMDYVANVTEGNPYSVTSPVINGYTATPVVVEGTMPGRDVVVTVIYVANTPAGTTSTTRTTVIDDYSTPLGIDGAYVQLGDCLE